MKKTIAILGLGRLGLSLIEELSHHPVDLIAIDVEEENVVKAAEFISNAFICDTTNEHAMRELGIANVDHAVVAFGTNLQATILTTIILKEMNIPKITVRVDTEYYISVMKKLGATDVILPQKMAATRLANKLVSDTFIDYFNISDEFCVVELHVNGENSPLNIQDLNPRNNYDVNLLLIQRDNRVFSPKGTDDILAHDLLFVFGKVPKITKFDAVINSMNKNQK